MVITTTNAKVLWGSVTSGLDMRSWTIEFTVGKAVGVPPTPTVIVGWNCIVGGGAPMCHTLVVLVKLIAGR